MCWTRRNNCHMEQLVCESETSVSAQNKADASSTLAYL